MAKKGKKQVKEKKEKSQKIKDEDKALAFLSFFLLIVGFLIVLLTKRRNKYVMHYAKQSLVLCLFMAVVGIADSFIGFIPIIGSLIIGISWIFMIVLWIVGCIYTLSGKKQNVLLIGDLAKNIDL